ncbi:MAG: tRNA lysidine(34) synthetase TilS [Chitinophagaceae bacterium]|nr:tRNA lysidine(34) synthetase TilS [Chitinophagaceae bacterium]
MNLYTTFNQFISSEKLFSSSDSLLIAASGGMDSSVLCSLCSKSGFRFKMAHCNFQLRGEESERDEQFVRELAARYQTELFVSRFDTASYAEAKKVSIQVAARELRYNWFHQINDIDYILTAHHADDNIETVMMNFFKGTGIAGLHGILPKQGKIVRPLLFAGREELEAYAVENGLSYITDSSNASDKYTRNYFRNQLIPALEKIYPSVKSNLQANIRRFRDAEILYGLYIEQLKNKLMEHKGVEVHIPVLKLQKSPAPETILYEIIKAYNFTSGQVKDVWQIMDSESGKYIASATHRIIKNRNWLVISPAKSLESATIVVDEHDSVVDFSGGQLKQARFSVAKVELPGSPDTAFIDAASVQYPMVLRKWKRGDYFYPLGMRKKKKLSRFFIDQKMSLTDKENAWVIEMNRKIVWVVGRRIDDRFKVTGNTREVIQLYL